MRYGRMLMVAGMLALGFGVGCEQAPKVKSAPEVLKAGASGKVLICAKCGQIKGSEQCCVKGQELCSHCGLVKDSPGCCILPKGSKTDVELCTKCGFIKDSADCCKATAKETCSKCGLVKGSPGCCKID